MFSLLALAAGPQGTDSKSAVAPPAPRGPVLNGDDGKPLAGVRLAGADIRAVVHGNLAQATMILTFANDLPRVLGGNLVFPLPEGATVTGYGLEINGVMVDGVAVEKERARIIYESELQKRVDPGLVENVEGNAFRTRLYPIPAKGSRSIKIEYVTQVSQAKDGPAIVLPLGMGEALDNVAVHIAAPEATASPTIKAGGMDGLAFAKAEHGFAADAAVKNAKLGEELVIGLPELPAKSVAVEKRLRFARTVEELEQHNHAADPGTYENYFVATDTPTPGQRQAVQLKNQRVGVVWDASLSRGDADHARELKLLAATLSRLGNPSVDLIVLRNDVQVQGTFAADANGTAKLIETIGALPYDGATALGSLILPKNASDYSANKQNLRTPKDYDLFLLFTDGFGNLGTDRPMRAEVPVYAMCDDVRANHALLRSICQESGGSYFNLRQMSDEQVLAGVGDAPFSLVSVECNPAEISEVYPPVGTAINGRFTVSGKLLVPQAKLTLHYGYGKEVVASETFTIDAADAAEGSLIPRFWAQQKVAALSLFPDKNAEALAQLGKQFNLVTPNTSLLVLETVEQYVQYRVVPPPTRPEIYKEFLAKIEESHAQVARTQEEKLQQVAAMWNARVKWWEQEYKYPANLKVNQEGGKFGQPLTNELTSGDAAGATPRPAPLARALANDPQLSTPPSQQAETARRIATLERHAAAADRPAAAPGDAPAPGVSAEHRAGIQPPEVAAVPSAQSGRARNEQALQQRGAQVPDFSDAPDFSLNSTSNKDQAKGELTPDGDVAAIAIKTWDPKTPYIAAMKAVAPEKAYDVYLAQRKAYAKSPAFYFDCADYLISINQRPMAIRVLSDIADLELHDARLLRVAAHRFDQIGERELAIDLFEKVLKLRPEEPQSYRDLALALADRADDAMTLAWTSVDNALPPQTAVDTALSDYTRSLELLNKVVLGNWSQRFPEVELPVLMEANDIAAKVQRLPRLHDFHNPIDARLQKNLDCDVRVVMTWDADQTDIDLWVTEPSGEKCFYAHNRTMIGGLLSHDFTDGYGPEEYCLRKLMPGKYTIQANYYGSRQQELTGPATVQATVITNFGRPNEKRQAMTLRLKDVKEVVDIGAVTLGDGKDAKAEGAPSSADSNR
jgi:tetratricopeptide (TPR) repeat protein